MSAPRIQALILAVGAIALIAALFMNWYALGGEYQEFALQGYEELSGNPGDPPPDFDVTGIETFTVIDFVLLAVAVAAAGYAGALAAPEARIPRTASVLAVGVGVLTVLLVVANLIDVPSSTDEFHPGSVIPDTEFSAFPEQVDIMLEPGAFLALAGAVAVAVGAFLSLRGRAPGCEGS